MCVQDQKGVPVSLTLQCISSLKILICVHLILGEVLVFVILSLVLKSAILMFFLNAVHYKEYSCSLRDPRQVARRHDIEKDLRTVRYLLPQYRGEGVTQMMHECELKERRYSLRYI